MFKRKIFYLFFFVHIFLAGASLVEFVPKPNSIESSGSMNIFGAVMAFPFLWLGVPVGIGVIGDAVLFAYCACVVLDFVRRNRAERGLGG